jgi:hypothetical protein
MDLTRRLVELLATLERYNLAIWPMQVLGYVLGFVALFFAAKPSKYSSRIIAVILSFLWLRIGIVFLPMYFGPVYGPVNAFAVMFIIQGLLFAVSVLRLRLSFGFKWDVYSAVGLLFIAYAMIGYPVVNYYFGYMVRLTPRFGVNPCPTVVFTFGLFLLTDKKLPKLLLVVPVLWTLGGVLRVCLGIFEDVALITAGIVGTAMILHRDRMIQE